MEGSRPNTKEILACLREDLKERVAKLLETAGMLAGIMNRQDIIEELAACVKQAAEILSSTGPVVPRDFYRGMQPRLVAALDVYLFGEQTIDEIQRHVLLFGFVFDRPGQIRSSINAPANRGYFNVDEHEVVTLTKKGKERAQELAEERRLMIRNI